MTEDQTLQQTVGGHTTSRRLSLQATTPPAEVPGYRLLKFLGSGAFGQVWVGRNLNTGRGVAVKFYLHRGGVNWSLLSREVKNLVQLSADRHVVQVLEVGWDADPPYYVMELVEGGSLEDLLKTRGRLPIDEAVTIFRKICVGLSHCHDRGVLHCDVKPANILMAEDREPRLADFGQSRMSHDQSPALGTLFYMAPEQADLDATPDASWDVYAAGAILYQMLTGRPPFRNETLVSEIDTAGSLPKRLQRYRESIQDQPDPCESLRSAGVDKSLQKVLRKCLAIDPAERYRNVQQILVDLRRRDETIARRPLMLLGIVGPLLLLLATSIFAARSINHATESTTSALRQEASGSNRLAARFAARTLQTEIEQYFEMVEDAAASTGLRTRLLSVLDDGGLREHRHAIAEAEGDDAAKRRGAARAALLDHPSRVELDDWIRQRLQKHVGPDAARPLATMFVTDSSGTILGIAYAEPVSRDRNSAGRNYSYRNYFHGGRDDFPKPGPDQRIVATEPLRSTHLSSAFESTATGLWKVAVSTPIYLDGNTEQQVPDAVFVATINLGDFKLLQSERGDHQVAVLVEARPGDRRGVVLQHPLMDARRRIGRSSVGTKFQIPESAMDELIEGGAVNYTDPVAMADDGAAYRGEWIAAIQPITLPENRGNPKTDLLVLVQYRLAEVFAPVRQMQRSLFGEGAAALAAILLVTLLMWYFVRRASAGDEIEDRETSSGGSSGMTETIPAA